MTPDPTLSRRSVLQGMCASAAVAAANQLWAPAAAFGATSDHTLVTIFLRGGLDGLSAVVPYGDARYWDARPTTGVVGAERFPLGGGFGLHPALAPLHELRGHLAVVHGAGHPMQNRSHFDSEAIIDAGAEVSGQLSGGWLARHLAGVDAAAAPLQAVGWGNARSSSLRGDDDAIAVGSLNSFGLASHGRDVDDVVTALRALYGQDDQLATPASATLDALGELTAIRKGAPERPETYPDTRLGRALFDVATTIKADAGLVAATIDTGGFDVHDAMGDVSDGRMTRLLDDLGRSLQAFARDLGGRMRKVTVVTLSEFGRRVRENGNGGTDHGRATAMFVLGDGIRAGVHGDWAGLDDEVLDRGDVPVVNDYRSVLADVLTRRVGGTDLKKVFPGFDHRPLGIA